MQAKRIVAKDMRTALSAVRDVLGPQAIILSNKRVSEGIELLCTLDQSVLQDEPWQVTDATQPVAGKNVIRDSAGQSVRPEELSDISVGNVSASAFLSASGQAVSSQTVSNQTVSNRVIPGQEKTSRNGVENKPAAKAEMSYLARELELMQKKSKQRAEQIRRQLESKRKTQNKQAVRVEAVDYPKFEDVALPSGKDELAAALKGSMEKSAGTEIASSVHRELNGTGVAQNELEYVAPVRQDLPSTQQDGMQQGINQQTGGFQSSGQGMTMHEDVQRRDNLSGLRAELNSMRELLQERLNGVAWHTFNDRNPLQARLWRRLRKLGLEPTVIQMLLASVNSAEYDNEKEYLQQAWMQTLQQLSAALPMARLDVVDDGGMHALVGPTGVGKTTTIGKLATDYVMKHGNDGLVLVTTDTYRIGGLEQLKVFGRLLNVPVKIVDTPDKLAATLHGLRSKQLVLIDSAGLSVDTPQLDEQLQVFRHLNQQINCHLVLSAAMQARVNERAYQCYRQASVKSCIISKLDESSELGSLLSLLVEQKLPASYMTNGQKIPDDIHSADATLLVNQAIKLTRLASRETLDEWQLAEEFSMPASMSLATAQTVRSL